MIFRHIYGPIEIDKLCLFINKILKINKKIFFNLIDKRLTLWDMLESLSKKK